MGQLLGSARFVVFFVLLATVGCGGGGKANIKVGTMPSGGTFTGVWSSPQYGELQMLQTGSSVVGEYSKDERAGKIQGNVTGDVLRFQWEERRELVAGRPTITRGRGYFRYEVGEDGKHYALGEWGIDDAESGGGIWRAYKLKRRRPSLSSSPAANDDSGSGGEDDDDSYDDQGGEEESSGGETSDEGLEGLDGI